MTILVAGHYCHDTLIGNDGAPHRTLGGSAAYISAVLDALGEPCRVVAKVGDDFLYGKEVSHAPAIVPGRTTAFVDDYRGAERRQRVEAVAPPILPEELEGDYQVGIACAIAGELPLPSLRRLRRASRVVVADAQSILREISPEGEVLCRPPEPGALDSIDFLKASKSEARALDVAALRQRMTLLITDGPRGCQVLSPDVDLHVPAEPAEERDPTGAGDCFLAGFAAGLARGLPLEGAARIGAFCGARAVEQVGVPRFDPGTARAALRSAERTR
ncbi:MAG TPA: PfkB family carbohydrate kinase [Myxococcales bacterium]|nr:PfkB family carbohydrate kinase [Myxococcales bacterium]